MKKYVTKDEKIIIKSLEDFNVLDILSCGQIFRYKKIGEDFVVYSKDKKATIKSNNDSVEIITKDVNYFINYFDLNTDYGEIKQKLSNFEALKPAIAFAPGIRILKQDPFEMIISFIISANNNIKRIQSIIEKICEKFGTYNKEEDFYAFPTQKQLLKASVTDFVEMGAGYRAQYLYNCTRQLENFNYDFIYNNKSSDCIPVLLNLSGIGPKVADCVLLFGFNKFDVFPVDTWIKKVYYSYFSKDKSEISVKEIRNNLLDIFGDLSGYAQQYLFFYKRSIG